MTNCTNLALLTQAWVVVALWSPWVFFFTKQSLRKNKMSHTWWWLAISFIQELKHRKNCKSYPAKVNLESQVNMSEVSILSVLSKLVFPDDLDDHYDHNDHDDHDGNDNYDDHETLPACRLLPPDVAFFLIIFDKAGLLAWQEEKRLVHGMILHWPVTWRLQPKGCA